jgi:DNA-binding transcriptional MerR regulator
MSERTRLLQIGEVADRVGLSLRTVRYYEEVGLVAPSARSDGGFRLYSDDDVERLLLIKRMKPLGLTLEEMGELAGLIARSESPSELRARELRRLVDSLGAYADRADTAIAKLERDLSEARQLRLRIGDRLGRCEATLEQTAARG